MKNFSLLFVVVFHLLCVGCATNGFKSGTASAGENRALIKGVVWELERVVVDDKVYKPLSASPVPTFFVKDNDIVTGSSTVNSYFGKVSFAKDGAISFGTGFGRTLRTVKREQKRQEEQFLEVLAKMKKCYVEGKKMYLSSEDESRVMIFRVGAK